MNKPIKKPMDILMHLVQDGCVPANRILGHAKSLEKAIDLDRSEKLNKAIEALEYYACEGYYITRAVHGSEDGKSMIEADNGKIARETLDEIRNRPVDLRGEETKESQDKEVEKME